MSAWGTQGGFSGVTCVLFPDQSGAYIDAFVLWIFIKLYAYDFC